jgi:hypothetical protein
MASNVRVDINHAAIRDIERSREVQDLLLRMAERIRDDAGDGFEAAVEVGTNRARAAVYTRTAEAMIAETYHHALTRAIDAGRG